MPTGETKICKGAPFLLDCEGDGNVLDIPLAYYGGKCRKNKGGRMETVGGVYTDRTKNVLHMVRRECNGKKECLFDSDLRNVIHGVGVKQGFLLLWHACKPAATVGV